MRRHPSNFRSAAPLRLHAGLLATLLVSALTGCGLNTNMVQPYTLPIQQGVVLEQSMLSRLKAGMTRNQVGLTLGTPLLADPLHADRWDYVYYTRVGGEVGEWRRLRLTFKDDRLASIDGDVTVAHPAAGPAAAPVVPATGEPAPAPSSGLPAPAPDAGKP